MQNIFTKLIMLALLGNIWSCSTTANKTQTTESKVTETKVESAPTSAISYKVTEGENHTFGYEISSNGTVMVRQPFIPAVAGRQGFVSKEEAESVAKLIVKKVERNIIPPTISIKELDSLHIHYNK